jgi:Flp pilus assembly pilin Flp
MNKLLKAACQFAREEDAPTMVEYGLLIACITTLSIFFVSILGQLTNEFLRDAAIVASIR